jgi:hypothetical protein
MEALLNVIASVGLAGSVALVVWGMVLSVRHGLGGDAAGARGTRLGDGASARSLRAAMGV